MNSPQQGHAFISYVREDKEIIDRLCQEFDKHGVEYWLDRKDIKPGADWEDAIRAAIRHGNFFIACFSERFRSKKKAYINEELTLAIEELRKISHGSEWFIPVLLSECDIPARSIGAGKTLLNLQWVSLYEDWDTGLQMILSVIKPIHPKIKRLINALESEDMRVRYAAANAIFDSLNPEFGGLNPDGNDKEVYTVIPPLIKALKDEYVDVVCAAARALRLISVPEDATSDIIPPLLDTLKFESMDIWRETLETIGYYGPEASMAVPYLIEVFNSDLMTEKFFLARTIRTLGKIGPAARAAVPSLGKALKDEEYRIRELAAEALGYIGPEAKSAVPLLVEALEDEFMGVRIAAESALIKIQR